MKLNLTQICVTEYLKGMSPTRLTPELPLRGECRQLNRLLKYAETDQAMRVELKPKC